jgi:hypothetical protein
MGACFGVSGRWPRTRSTAALVACGALTLACTGEKFVVGGERAVVEPRAGGPAMDAGVASNLSDVPRVEDCPASPAARRESFGCWPPRHLGRYQGFFLGAPRYETLDGAGADFPTGLLLLELGDDGRGELTFGEGGAGAEREPCAGLESPRCASIGRLLPGFAYELEDIALFDPMDEPPRVAGEPPMGIAESMSFVVWLGQPWQAWCADSPSPKAACPSNDCAGAPPAPVPGGVAGPRSDRTSACRCAQSGCRPPATSLALTLRMSGDGRALRGVYEPSDRAFGDALLEFTREVDP